MTTFWLIIATVTRALGELKLPPFNFGWVNGESSFFVPLSVVQEFAQDYVRLREERDGAVLESIDEDVDVEVMLHFKGDEAVDARLSGMSATIWWEGPMGRHEQRQPSSTARVTPEELVACFMTRLYEFAPLDAAKDHARWKATLALRRSFPGMIVDSLDQEQGKVRWFWEVNVHEFALAFADAPYVVLDVVGGQMSAVEVYGAGDRGVYVGIEGPSGVGEYAPPAEFAAAWEARLKAFDRHVREIALGTHAPGNPSALSSDASRHP